MSQDSHEPTITVAEAEAAPAAGEPTPTPAQTAAEVAQRPEGIPERFWDPEAGALRAEALLESHRELEGKLGALAGLDGGAAPDEATRARLLELLGRPSGPEGYAIAPPNALLEPDPELNGRLHAAGFTQSQAQLVYELAAERLVPVVAEVVGEMEAQRQVDRLQRHFGGPEAWAGVARQLKTWGEGNLEPDVLATLSSSYDGVLALHRMSQAGEPRLLDGAGTGGAELSEDALGDMVRDPRYWRRRDPDFVAKVTAGFRRLYGEG